SSLSSIAMRLLPLGTLVHFSRRPVQLTREASESCARGIVGNPGTSRRTKSHNLLNYLAFATCCWAASSSPFISRHTALRLGTGILSRSPSRTMKPVNYRFSVGAPRATSRAIEPAWLDGGIWPELSCRHTPWAETQSCRPVALLPPYIVVDWHTHVG